MNKPKTIIAIDPGASGGFAIRHHDSIIQTFPMPDTEGEIVNQIRNQKKLTIQYKVDLECMMELVGGYVGGKSPGSHMFNFGRNFGFVLAVLQTLQIPVTLVPPQKWQKGLGLGNSKSHQSKAHWKRHLKGEAQRRYPHANVTLKTADALLILSYATQSLNHSNAQDEPENQNHHIIPLDNQNRS